MRPVWQRFLVLFTSLTSAVTRLTRGVLEMRHNVPCLAIYGFLAVLSITTTGCSFFPESLQPHSLQKLNRGTGFSDDEFFSVPDNDATARRKALKNAFHPEIDEKTPEVTQKTDGN